MMSIDVSAVQIKVNRILLTRLTLLSLRYIHERLSFRLVIRRIIRLHVNVGSVEAISISTTLIVCYSIRNELFEG